MSQDVYVLIEHRDGAVGDGNYELLGKARELAAESGGEAVALVLGEGVEELARGLGAAQRAIVIDGPSLANFTPTAYVAALAPVLRDRQPMLVLFPNSAVGMDSAAGLSATLDLPLAAYAVDVRLDGGQPVITSQIYGGKINAESVLDAGRGLVTVIGGSFPADAGKVDGSPEIERLTPEGEDSRVRFRQLLVPEAGDVDITREEILVSVGRGIGDQDEIEVAEELAAAIGGAVAASRPIIDAGWLPKTRQVGKSGLTVKPKLYVALGVSGAPEHLEGMRDAETIIAINTDPGAPIFSVAHYGVVADLFDIVPELTERVQAGAGA